MGIGPIPRSKVRDYATEELELTGEDRDWFCAVIARVDNEYISIVSPRKDADGPPMRDIAPVNDPQATRRVLKNLARKPQGKTPNPNG